MTKPKVKGTKEAYIDEEVFGEAEAMRGLNVESLRLMALFAYDHRRSRPALRACTAAFERNAELMARAVTRWPEYFMATDGAPCRGSNVDELLALFAIARLKLAEAEAMVREMQRLSLRYHQVVERLELRLLARAKNPSLRIKRAAVHEITKTRVELYVHPEHRLPDEAVGAWKGKEVTVVLRERPEVKDEN